MFSESQHKQKWPGLGSYYMHVREGAQSIFNVLKKKIQTPHSCKGYEHSVCWCLEIKNAGMKSPTSQGNPALFFRLVELERIHWRDQDKEPQDQGRKASLSMHLWVMMSKKQ